MRFLHTTGSWERNADAAESALSGYMAWIALTGLVVNTIWNNPRPTLSLLLLRLPSSCAKDWKPYILLAWDVAVPKI